MSVRKKLKLDPSYVALTEKNLAALEVDETKARFCLGNSGFLNKKTKDGSTALHIACKNGFNKLVLILLENNADVNASNDRGKTPLHMASENNEKVILELLLKGGANVNAQDKGGKTSLHIAAFLLFKKAVKLLIKFNADVNIKDAEGRTPIFYAFSDNNVNMIRSLFKRGADVDIRDQDIYTPSLDIYGCSELDDYEFLRLDLDYDNDDDVNCRSKDGKTPLHLPSIKNTVKILLEHGAEVNAHKDKGETPLQVAVMYYNDIAQKYIGKTPLQIAVMYNIEVAISSLLKYGADINIADNFGNLPVKNLDNLHENRRIADITAEHIMKLNVAGILVCDKNLDYSDWNYSGDIPIFEEEVNLLKDRKLSNTISFHDILINPRIKLADFHGDIKGLVKFLAREDYITEFPLYSNLLTLPMENLRKKVIRKCLLDEAHLFFGSSNYFMMLPFECVEEILSYLKDEDLSNALEMESESGDSDSKSGDSDSSTSETSDSELDSDYD